jgi:endo-1,4-beta-mannosidase
VGVKMMRIKNWCGRIKIAFKDEMGDIYMFRGLKRKEMVIIDLGIDEIPM